MMVGPRVADLVRLEKQRQGKTQEILDKVIGKGRSLVRVTVVDWDDRGDVIRLKRLSLALVVDQTKIVVDEEGGEVYSEPRSQEELAALTQLAVGAAGISRERGDRVVSRLESFDRSQEIQQREAATSKGRKEFWKGISVVGPLLLLAIYLFWRGGLMGAAIAIGAGAALVLSPIGLRDGPAVALGLGLLLLIIGIDRLRQVRAEGAP